jgi:hypothetical protein
LNIQGLAPASGGTHSTADQRLKLKGHCNRGSKFKI